MWEKYTSTKKYELDFKVIWFKETYIFWRHFLRKKYLGFVYTEGEKKVIFSKCYWQDDKFNKLWKDGKRKDEWTRVKNC